MDYGDNSLVGYWPLTEGTGTVAYDDSGNNATGTWSGTATGTSGYYSPGKGGGYSWAGAFDGSTDYVSTVASSNWDTALVTISLWFFSPSLSTSGYQYLFASGNYYSTGFMAARNANPSGEGCTNTSSTFGIIVYSGASLQIYCNLSNSGGWILLTLIYNNNTQNNYLYINGVSAGSQSYNGQTTILGSAKSIGIGARSSAHFSGLINGVRIYNRALSAAQIAAMYAGGK